MLTTLIYRSQVHPDRPPVDLDTLVHRASSKNLPLGITGILLFNGLQFFQVLEGTEEALESLFSEIQSDPRHRDVVELMRDYSAYRRFHGTGMRILDLRLFETDGALEEILRFSTFGVTEPVNDRMFRLLSAFIADGGLLPARAAAALSLDDDARVRYGRAAAPARSTLPVCSAGYCRAG